jgi:hypothetical protein
MQSTKVAKLSLFILWYDCTVHAGGFLVAKYEKLINCTQDKLPVTSLITTLY